MVWDKGAPLDFSLSKVNVSLTFPFQNNCVNCLVMLLVRGEEEKFGFSPSWMVLPSWSKSASCLLDQSFMQHSISFMWSIVFDLLLGFCSNRAGKTMAAFTTTDWRAESSTYATFSFVTSFTKRLLVLPDWTSKSFLSNVPHACSRSQSSQRRQQCSNSQK